MADPMTTISTDPTTLLLDSKEDRRVWRSLTKLAADPKERASLSFVVFDGRDAWATDAIVLGRLTAIVKIPDHPDGEPRDRVAIEPSMLRDVIALAKGPHPVRLRFDPDALVVVIGHDTLDLGDDYGPTTVRIPYSDAELYPATETLRRSIDGVDEDGIADVTEVVTKLGVNAASIGRLGALAHLESGGDPLVSLHPRSRSIQVRNADHDEILGVMSRLLTLEHDQRWDEQEGDA